MSLLCEIERLGPEGLFVISWKNVILYSHSIQGEENFLESIYHLGRRLNPYE